MLVVCEVKGCSYKSKDDFCRNKVLKINMNGTCGYVYNKRGELNKNYQEKIEEWNKERMQVYDFLDQDKKGLNGVPA